MRKADELFLKRLKSFSQGIVSEADWALVVAEVERAGSVFDVNKTAAHIIGLAIEARAGLEKASFASRSEAGRYAANMRWRGSNPKGLEGAQADARAKAEAPQKQIITPEESQIVGETMSIKTQGIYQSLREKGMTHTEAYVEAKAQALKPKTSAPAVGEDLADDGSQGRLPSAKAPKTSDGGDREGKKQRVAEHRAALKDKDISEIAREVRRELRAQGKQVPPALAPYLDAMGSLGTVNDRYMEDSGVSVVAYALSNMGSFKGEKAAAIKEELKARIKK